MSGKGTDSDTDYSNNYKNNRSYEEISLFGTNIFDKFLKISKKTSDCKKMDVLKSQVEDKIKPFAEYVFSPVLQAEFFQ